MSLTVTKEGGVSVGWGIHKYEDNPPPAAPTHLPNHSFRCGSVFNVSNTKGVSSANRKVMSSSKEETLLESITAMMTTRARRGKMLIHFYIIQ